MIQIMKVTGESLSPFFLSGDYIVILKIPFFLRNLKAGDFIVFNHPVYGMLIKKIDRILIESNELFVLGTNSKSTDSRDFGPIPRRWVFGKVVTHIRGPFSE
jgi:nickel-type superoxide dismutase maturation protease